eukprot:764738-Prymnesium_polylepis.1
MGTACNAIVAPTAPAMRAPVLAKDKSCAIGSKWMRTPSTAVCAACLSARHPMAPGVIHFKSRVCAARPERETTLPLTLGNVNGAATT